MEPYAECWCGSGKKWKWCHKNRASQTPKPIGKLMHEQRRAAQLGYCSHPEAGPSRCGTRIVRSHTVQRGGGLAAIAESGHVMSVKEGSYRMFDNNGSVIPERVGINSASTFNGFCGTHDSSMFRPVEAGCPVLTRENAFLLSFRAISYELHAKRVTLDCAPVLGDMDLGQPFEMQAVMQQWRHLYLLGTKRGIDHFTKWKLTYDQCFLARDLSKFRVYAVAFSDILPIVACGAFHPEFDFSGKRLQIISRGNEPFDHIALNLTSLEGRSIATLSWTETGADVAREFLSSFQQVPDDQKANALVHLAFEQLENTYLRPSWWTNLPAEQRTFALQKFSSGTVSTPRNEGALRDRPVKFVDATVTEVIAIG